MRVVVDLTRCQGYAQCAFLAPDVFRMSGDEALMYDPEPAEAQRERVQRAAAACPVQAMRVDHLDLPKTHQNHTNAVNIVIVGGSLAGLRAAAELRAEGFTGSLTVIEDEPYEPYDRPPLSKHVLAGWPAADHLDLPDAHHVDADWRLGVAATGLDLAGKRVLLGDGDSVPFDRLLIATGVRARRWPDPAEAALDGVLTLRTRDDSAKLRTKLTANPRRVLVIGAGFTGSEVASMCCELGIPVTVAEAGPAPLVGALGAVIGEVAADLQRANGVDLHTEVLVTKLEGDEHGRLRRAHLSDGTTLDVDVAVAALGGLRNVEWLHDSGLAVGEWGVACDAGCRAFDVNGVVTDDVFVAGDVARVPNAMFGYEFLALEHWHNAVEQAAVAAHNMISGQAERWPYLTMPEFWSTQFGVNIKSVGVPTLADEVAITQGSVAERRFAAVYGYKGRVTAAVAFDQAHWLEFYERLIEQAAPFPPTFSHLDEPTFGAPMPAQVPTRASAVHEATVVVTGHEPSRRRARIVRSPR
jgi:NADPH-dependent 2,4-dienoyl-CoA reductase/sulfur reductase-like enzyme/ferredoxin